MATTTKKVTQAETASVERAFHPTSAIFPLMEGDEFSALVADIQAHGLREEIWTDREGQIIDGRNRYRACLAANVEPRFRTWDETADGGLVPFVVSLNLKRRHLDEGQRAMVANRLAALHDGQRKAAAPIGAAAQDEAAALLKVGRRSVQRARKVQKYGIPELVQAVDKGEVRVSAAAVVSDLPKAEQTAIVAKGPKAVRATAKQIHAAKKPLAPSTTSSKVQAPGTEGAGATWESRARDGITQLTAAARTQDCPVPHRKTISKALRALRTLPKRVRTEGREP